MTTEKSVGFKQSIRDFASATSLPEIVLYGLALVGFVFTLVGAGLNPEATALVACATVALSVVLLIRARAWAAALATKEGEARAELAAQRQEAADALVETQQYRAELTRMFIDDVEISEVQEIVYTLSGAGSDRYSITATTTPESDERCRWRRVRVKGDGPTEGVNAQLLSAGATLLELDDVEGFWSGLVLFDPPISPGESREWTLQLLWPRMADPLRENGTDSCWFYTEIPVPDVTIKIKYTQDWVQKYGPAPGGFNETSPNTGTTRHDNVLGDDVISWHIHGASVRQYYMAYLERAVASSPV